MTRAALNHLLEYINGLNLTASNRRWLSEHLTMPEERRVDDIQMSEKEFYDKIELSLAQARRGETVSMNPGESSEDFLNRIACIR